MKYNIKPKFKKKDEVYYIVAYLYTEKCDSCGANTIKKYTDPIVVSETIRSSLLEGKIGTNGLNIEDDTESIELSVMLSNGIVIPESKCFATQEEAEEHLNDEEYLNKL